MRFGYARLSTVEQASGQALEQQVKRLQDAGCVEIVHDLASGTKDNRPQLQALLKRLGPGDVVVATRLDRLTRNASFNNRLCELFSQDNGPRLECLDDSVDTSTVMGRAAFRMMGVFAQAEVERLRERVMHGVRHRRDEIGASQGRAPFGFRRAIGQPKLEVDPKTGPIARELLARLIETADPRGCCLWLVAEHGIKLSAKGLKHWVLNPALVGDTGRSKPRAFNEKGARVAVKPGEFLRVDPDTHDPLISRSTWAACQVAIDRSRKTPGAQRRAGLKPQWFSGRIICCECGHKMNQNARIIRCTNEICGSRYSAGSITREEAKSMVLAALRGLGPFLASRMAPLLTVSVDEEKELPELKLLLEQIATLKSTGLVEVEAVIARLQGQVANLQRQATGFRDNEAEQLRKLLGMIGTPEAVAAISDADLLTVMSTADIQVVLHQQMPAWVLVHRWPDDHIAWYLTKRQTAATMFSYAAGPQMFESMGLPPQPEEAWDEPVSDEANQPDNGDEPLVPYGEWIKPRRVRIGDP